MTARDRDIAAKTATFTRALQNMKTLAPDDQEVTATLSIRSAKEQAAVM